MSSITPERSLSRHVDPHKFAQQGVNLRGTINVNLLPRLCELLADSSGIVNADLIFSVGDQGLGHLSGRAVVDLNMHCQRCLNSCVQTVQASFQLVMISRDEQIANLHKDLDVWMVSDGSADLYRMVEDEIILAVPIIAYHDHECVPKSLFSAGGDEQSSEQKINSKASPFQALEKLKHKSFEDD